MLTLRMVGAVRGKRQNRRMTTAAAPQLAPDHACLIVHGTDRPGIIAAVSALITRHGGNIVAFDQYSDDPRGGDYFQRVVFHRPDLSAQLPAIEADIAATLGGGFELEWSITDQSVPKRMAILSSKQDHCLLDLLWRHRRGELPVSVPMVISNHTSSAEDVRSFGVPFFHVPGVAGPDKSASEEKILELLVGNVDFVVLARYMQILSADFLQKLGVPVINIHHSFLPAFIGAEPYKKAKQRGVKLIGATSHYVTMDLDEGPIIEQDTVRVTHGDSLAELVRKGADVERQVLSRAVLWHAQDRVIRHGNHTIVF
jgi:formyltetrahydrofolate deformylase